MVKFHTFQALFYGSQHFQTHQLKETKILFLGHIQKPVTDQESKLELSGREI